MAPIQDLTPNPRLPETSSQSIRRLFGRIERRRPKPRIEAAPEYYHDLIEELDNTTAIPQNYSDASKDNIRGIRVKFIR
jgi:hypothetical protein